MRDVTVLGAGIFGLSVAWACRKRGASVQVIDPEGVGAGSSGGIVGALAPHIPENWNEKKQFQFESLSMSEPFWTEIEALSGLKTGYAKTGRVQPVLDQRSCDHAKSRAFGAQEFWQGEAVWRVEDRPLADGWHPPSPTGHWIFDSLSALIHPRQACKSIAHALRKNGVEIVSDGPREGRIVHATGWKGLVEMSEHLGEPIGNGVKGQALLLDHDAAGKPQIYVDGLHIIPHLDGTVAIGSTSERIFESPITTDDQLDTLLERAIAALPCLSDAQVLARWAGVRPRARSRAPMLGTHPFIAGAFVANGGFKIGFGMAPKVGEVMADLILEKRDTIPESFRADASIK